jgi:hypothetical protein
MGMAEEPGPPAARDAAPAEERWHLAAAGIVVALIAMLLRLFDDELAALIGAEDRTGIVDVAQALGLAAVVVGVISLWRKQIEVLCGGAMVLGAVAMFFDLFVVVAFVALLVVIGVALYRLFSRR